MRRKCCCNNRAKNGIPCAWGCCLPPIGATATLTGYITGSVTMTVSSVSFGYQFVGGGDETFTVGMECFAAGVYSFGSPAVLRISAFNTESSAVLFLGFPDNHIGSVDSCNCKPFYFLATLETRIFLEEPHYSILEINVG